MLLGGDLSSSGLLLPLLRLSTDDAYWASYLRRSSATLPLTLPLRVAVGDGKVDPLDGVSGSSLDPASDGW